MTNDDFGFDCILWGANAWGNSGDELTLAIALNDAQKRFGDSIAILTPFPERMKQLFPNTKVIPYFTELLPPQRQKTRQIYLYLRKRGWLPDLRKLAFSIKYQAGKKRAKAPAWMKTIAKSKLLYLVGGGYITDHFEIDYYLLPLQIAESYSVPISTAPIGLGPFFSKRTAAAVVHRFKHSTVCVRDKFSLEFCVKNDIPAILKSDDGFRVKEVLSDLQLRHPLQENKETKQRIGICIHRQENQEKHLIEKWWINFLSNLKTYPNIEVRGFCFNADPAQDFSTLLYLFEASGHQREAVQQPPENFRDAIKHLRNFNLVVSTRFHSIVVAHALKLPYLAIASGEYYFNKISSIPIAQDSQSKLLDPTKNTPQEAVIQLTSCLNKAQSTKQILNP